MAGGRCPETPRQKLIGMMYLFLTAMLAMNVSTMVLEAFRDIENSLQSTLLTIEEKNRRVYDEIATQAIQDQEYEALALVANEIETRSNNLVSEIENIKLMIINHSSGRGYDDIHVAVSEVQKLDDLYAARDIMVEGYGEAAGVPQGPMIKEMIDEHRVFLLSLISDQEGSPLYQSINENLSTPQKIDPRDGLTFEWEQAISFNMPMMATIALLTKMQADIRNAEGDILNYLIMEIEGGVDIRITSLEGLVSAPRGFIIRGGEYRANIFLGARDSTMDPLVYIRDQYPFWKTELNETGDTVYKLLDEANPLQYYDTIQSRDGYARFTQAATRVGDNQYGGLIMYQTRRGKEYYPFTGNYTVGDAGFTVSATNCAVFYRGLDNPVDVAVSGYPREAVNVSISGGASIRRHGQAYMVSVPQSVTADVVRVTVSVRTDEGGRTLGSQEFRVLNVPPPSILLGGAYKDGATVPRAAVTQNPFLSARLEADFFPFEGVSYEVTKFDFLYSVRGVTSRATVNGSRFSAEVMEQVNIMTPGQALSFSNIFVRGPSGVRQTQGINVILR